jgi:ABC-2 type transport system permease protein
MQDNEFVLAEEKGWLAGFSSMLDKENGRWWKTNTWLQQAFIWFMLLNVPLLFILYISHPTSNGIPMTAPETALFGVQVFMAVSALYLPFGVSIMTHDAIIKEREMGTMAWILSKPVTRKSFVLAKIVANTAAVLILMVFIQGIIDYGILSLYNEALLNAVNYFGALCIIALLSLFYLGMMFALGSLTTSRYLVLGAAVVFIILGMAASYTLPDISAYLTWKMPETAREFAFSGNLTFDGVIQLVATGVWIMIFFLISIFQVERIEL